MPGPDIADQIEGIVHEPTQVHDDRVDLTAQEIYEVAEPGRVDFGGGELEDAKLRPHDRTLRNEDDDYEWWHLDAGTYLLAHNESLVRDAGSYRLETREELRHRGAYHPTLTVEDLGLVPLTVGGAGVRIKENARVSTLQQA